MSDALGLVIDFIFDEDKINKNAEKLLKNLRDRNVLSLETKIDDKTFTELANKVKEFSKTRFTFDENGNVAKELSTIELGLGRILNVVRDSKGTVIDFSFNVDNSKLEQEIMKEMNKTLSAIESKEKELLKAGGEREKLLRSEISKLEEKKELLLEHANNQQTFERIQRRIIESDNKISDLRKRENAEAQDLLNTQRKILEARLETLRTSDGGRFFDDSQVKEFADNLKNMTAETTKEAKRVVDDMFKEFDALKIKADLDQELFKEASSLMEQMSKKQLEMNKLQGTKKQIAKEEYEQMTLNLNTLLMTINNDKLRLSIMNDIAKQHDVLSDKMIKEERVAEELLKKEQERLKSDVSRFTSTDTGSFSDNGSIDEFIKKLDSIKATSIGQVREEIEKLKKEFSNIKLDAGFEKGVYENAINLITQISNKEKELLQSYGSKKELVEQEYNELVRKLGVTLDEVESQQTLNRIMERQVDIAKDFQSYAEKEQAVADDKIKSEQKALDLMVRRIKQSRDAKYISDDEFIRIEKLEQAIRNLDGVSLSQVTHEVSKLKGEINELSSDLVTKRILETSNSLKSLTEKLEDLGIHARIDLEDIFEVGADVVGKGVDYVRELDDAYTDVAVSMNTSREEFASWTEQARKIAQANGQMTTSALDMVKIYATAGEEFSTIADRLEGTLQIQNITQWDAEQTTSAVNSIINQYGLLEEEIDGKTENISGAINLLGDSLIGISNALTVDNVTGIQEMVEAVDTAGGVMKESGASLQYFMAIAATLNETMNAQGSEVGHAYKMISARIFAQAQAMEELGESTENIEVEARKAEKALNSVGVSVREAGDPSSLRSMEDILGDLAEKWDTLSDATKRYVAEGVAGTNRSSFFLNTIENYDRVLELTKEGMNAQGALAEASEVRAASLAGRIEVLTDKFLSLMDGLTPVLYGLTELGIGLLDIIHFIEPIPSLIGLATAAMFTFTDAGKGFASSFIDAIPSLDSLNKHLVGLIRNGQENMTINEQLADSLKKVEVNTSGVTSVVKGASDATQNLARNQMATGTASTVASTGTKLFNSSLVATKAAALGATIGVTALQAAMSFGLSIAITGIISGVTKLVSSLKSVDDGASDTISSMTDLSKAISESETFDKNLKSLEESYEKLEQTKEGTEEQKQLMSEINAIEETIAGTSDKAYAIIHNKNLALEDQLALLKEINKESLQESADEFQKETKQKDINRTRDSVQSQAEKVVLQDRLIAEATDSGATKVNYLGTMMNLEELIKLNKETESSFKTSYASLVGINSQLEHFKNSGVQVNLSAAEISDQMKQAWESVSDTNDELETTKTSTNEVKNNVEAIANASEKLYENQREATGAYLETTNSLEEARSLLSDIQENGMNLDNANSLFDMFEDYSGNITDAGDAIEFLKGKIGELEQIQGVSYFEMLDESAREAVVAQERAYLDMMANDEEFWNQKIKNSDLWKNHVQESNEAIRDFNRSVLGEEASDYALFIDEKLKQREIDLQNAQTLGEAEKIFSSNMVNDLSSYFAQLVNDKTVFRDNDYDNVINFLNAQGNSEINTIAQLRDAWRKYYQEKWKALDTELRELESKYEVVYEGDRENIYSQFAGLEKENQQMQNLFNSLDLSFKVAGSKLSQTTVGSSGLKKPSSSSSSSNKGSSSSTERVVEDLDLEIDRYYKLNDALDDVNNKLERNEKLQEKATTKKEYLKLLNDEKDLIDDKRIALQNLLKEQQKEANEIKKTLSSQGFKFDGENLVNYQSQLIKLQNQANKLSGEAKEQAKEKVQHLANLINQYTTLTNNSIPDTKNQLLDLDDVLKDIKEKQEEINELVADYGDRYYKVLQEIQKIDNQLSLIDAASENATAKDRVFLLDKEIQLLKDKQKLLKQQQSQTLDEVEEIREELVGYGIQFDTDGMLKNYDALLKKLSKKANDLVGTGQEDQIEEIEKMIELVERYDELYKETLPDLATEWIDIHNQIVELERSKLESIADVEKQITDAITAELEKRTEATKKEIQKQKDLYLQEFEVTNCYK